jgi:hypothetical protein
VPVMGCVGDVKECVPWCLAVRERHLRDVSRNVTTPRRPAPLRAGQPAMITLSGKVSVVREPSSRVLRRSCQARRGRLSVEATGGSLPALPPVVIRGTAAAREPLGACRTAADAASLGGRFGGVAR